MDRQPIRSWNHPIFLLYLSIKHSGPYPHRSEVAWPHHTARRLTINRWLVPNISGRSATYPHKKALIVHKK